jgi:hypothetical protein
VGGILIPALMFVIFTCAQGLPALLPIGIDSWVYWRSSLVFGDAGAFWEQCFRHLVSIQSRQPANPLPVFRSGRAGWVGSGAVGIVLLRRTSDGCGRSRLNMWKRARQRLVTGRFGALPIFTVMAFGRAGWYVPGNAFAMGKRYAVRDPALE